MAKSDPNSGDRPQDKRKLFNPMEFLFALKELTCSTSQKSSISDDAQNTKCFDITKMLLQLSLILNSITLSTHNSSSIETVAQTVATAEAISKKSGGLYINVSVGWQFQVKWQNCRTLL
ncbi:hypothetical protein HYX10_04805 [Candidatus Woesearchaeota archaeon]|nr:hypothetical protein [Candidatus Woesearchaeota archaeon]